eukprot:TRINITY_DN59350_c0_g1_i1.p1 TRINITY_DN59350_c0_g1~~TRINITY_DN59350_c0_g1_i1.p1  ORF type:complete len:707 (-),score=100.53 TRINITY_DN59350_c0_g1_i1:107-2227(-)
MSLPRDYVEDPCDTSYWGGGKAKDILKTLGGSKWSDPDFPPESASLYYDANNCPGFEAARGAQWKRLSDMWPDCELFKGTGGRGKKIGASDIMQGALGDCWLMSAMSIIATRPDLLQNLIVEAHPDQAVYEFRFFKEGAWVTVAVDDYVPIADWDAPLLARSKDDGEVWVPLLEKAYAKLHGHYQCLNGGATVYGLVDMTGGAAETINFDRPKGKNLIEKGLLLRRLRQCKAEGWLMGCAFRSSGGAIAGKVETTAELGLIGGHAYAVLDLRQVRSSTGCQTWILRLRNPWGQSEWQGPWSDGSREWTQSTLSELGYQFGNDGTFWMSFEDWQRTVASLDICRTYRNTLDDPFYYAKDIKGQWSNATGSAVGQGSLQNPQYIITADEDTSAYISLMQEDNMYIYKDRPSLAYAEKCIGFWLLKSKDGDRCQAKAIYKKLLAAKGPSPFVRGRTTSMEVKLKKGVPLIIMPTQYTPGVEAEYQLYVFSAGRFSMKRTTNSESGSLMPAEELVQSPNTKKHGVPHEKGWRHECTEPDADDDDEDDSPIGAEVESVGTREDEAAAAIKQQKQKQISKLLDYIVKNADKIEEPVNVDWIIGNFTKTQNWMKQLIATKEATKGSSARGGRRLGADDVASIRQAFSKYDTDRSGSINVKEFQNLMRDIGQTMKWYDAQRYLNQLDPDRTGKLEFGEFLDWYPTLNIPVSCCR